MKQAKTDAQDGKPPTVLATDSHQSFYQYWMNEAPESPLKNYYSKNEHLSLLKSLYVQIVSDIDEAHRIWEEFSPHENLFDTWEFRYAFFEGYNPQIHFIVLKKESENVAVLPLWYEKDKNRYVWFGSYWQEENIFFSKDPLLVPLLLSICPTPLHLNAIKEGALKQTDESVKLELDDPKYVLDLTTFTKIDQFLLTLKKKRRYNLRRDYKHIEAQNPEIIIDDYGYFDTMVTLSKKRFEQKGEETDWEDPRRIETFKNVVESGQKGTSFTTRMITVKINGIVAAVDLIAIYKGCYYPLKCAYNIAEFPGIGNFVNLYEIKDALALGMKKMDFLEIDYGWKKKWFQEVPLYKYERDYVDPDDN